MAVVLTAASVSCGRAGREARLDEEEENRRRGRGEKIRQGDRESDGNVGDEETTAFAVELILMAAMRRLSPRESSPWIELVQDARE